MKNELELSPLRSLDDFLLGSARFQLPNYKDLEKWGNRVMQNLLYYQTNYFLMAISMIMLFTLMHPLKMILGFLSVLLMAGLFYFTVNASSSATRFKKNHPLVGVLLIVAGACLAVYLLGSLIVFLLGILSPISAIFIHASFRLRNIKNKLSNIERVVSNKTPMGVLLETLGRYLPSEVEFVQPWFFTNCLPCCKGTGKVDTYLLKYPPPHVFASVGSNGFAGNGDLTFKVFDCSL